MKIAFITLACFLSVANALTPEQKSKPIRMFEEARAKGRISDQQDVKLQIKFNSNYQPKTDQANPLDTAFIWLSYQPDDQSLPISAILRPQSKGINLWESMLPKTGEFKISIVYVNKRNVQISELGPAAPLQFGKNMNYIVTLDQAGKFKVDSEK